MEFVDMNFTPYEKRLDTQLRAESCTLLVGDQPQPSRPSNLHGFRQPDRMPLADSVYWALQRGSYSHTPLRHDEQVG